MQFVLRPMRARYDQWLLKPNGDTHYAVANNQQKIRAVGRAAGAGTDVCCSLREDDADGLDLSYLQRLDGSRMG